MTIHLSLGSFYCFSFISFLLVLLQCIHFLPRRDDSKSFETLLICEEVPYKYRIPFSFVATLISV